MAPSVQIALIISVCSTVLVVFLAIIFKPRIKRIKANVAKGTIDVELLSEERKAQAKKSLVKAEQIKANARTAASLSIEVQRVLDPGRRAEDFAPPAEPQKELSATTQRIEHLDRPLNKRILWVDDHPENNAYECSAMESIGVEVIQVTNNRDAYFKLEFFKYDLVITDIGRDAEPENGLDLLERIKARTPTLPVIVYTSEDTVHSLQLSHRFGGSPLTANPATLLQMVIEAFS